MAASINERSFPWMSHSDGPIILVSILEALIFGNFHVSEFHRLGKKNGQPVARASPDLQHFRMLKHFMRDDASAKKALCGHAV